MNGRLEKEMKFYGAIEEKLKTLPSVFNDYYISMRANRKSYTTINVYINNILHFINFLGDNISENFYKHITASDIERYIISLETRETKNGIQRMGDDILQCRWSSLNNFFDWLMKRNYISINPMSTVNRPKNNTQHKVIYLTKVEINRLYRAIERNPNEVESIRDETLIKVALATALRISALLNLNIDDIDFDNNVINVIEKRQKVRSIQIGNNLQELLKNWIKIRNEVYANTETNALFLSNRTQRMSDDAANYMLKKYCKEAEIKVITFHKLRASAACMLAKNGMPLKTIAKQLGHNSTEVTQRYVAAFDEDNEKALNILDGLV